VILPSPSSLFSFSLSLFLALFAPNAFRRQIKTTDVYGGGRGRRRGRRGGGSFFFEGILEGKNSLSPLSKRREKKKKEGPSKNQKPKTKKKKTKKRRSRPIIISKKKRDQREPRTERRGKDFDGGKNLSHKKALLCTNIIVLVESSSFILSRTHARAHAHINRRNDDDE
tara:strand:- start:3550 stop:4056 length:507 start_codon:yes stop_codon:yes gene_type:complete